MYMYIYIYVYIYICIYIYTYIRQLPENHARLAVEPGQCARRCRPFQHCFFLLVNFSSNTWRIDHYIIIEASWADISWLLVWFALFGEAALRPLRHDLPCFVVVWRLARNLDLNVRCTNDDVWCRAWTEKEWDWQGFTATGWNRSWNRASRPSRWSRRSSRVAGFNARRGMPLHRNKIFRWHVWVAHGQESAAARTTNRKPEQNTQIHTWITQGLDSINQQREWAPFSCDVDVPRNKKMHKHFIYIYNYIYIFN